MNVNNINSATLKSLSSLIAKKENLEAQLAEIDVKISEVLTGTSGKAAKTAKATAPKTGKVRGKRGGKKGGLKESILAILKEAAGAPVSAKEISEKLGIPNQSVHVWFGTTGKKVEGLKKADKGVWTLSA